MAQLSASVPPEVKNTRSGGEEHPVRLGSHGGGDLVPGGAQFVGGVDAEIVQGAGIGPALRHGFGHGLHGLGTGLGGGGIV